jgi:hypothetical protein
MTGLLAGPRNSVDYKPSHHRESQNFSLFLCFFDHEVCFVFVLTVKPDYRRQNVTSKCNWPNQPISETLSRSTTPLNFVAHFKSPTPSAFVLVWSEETVKNTSPCFGFVKIHAGSSLSLFVTQALSRCHCSEPVEQRSIPLSGPEFVV